MKSNFSSAILLFLVVCLFGVNAEAKRKNGKKDASPTPTPTQFTVQPDKPPSVNLGNFIHAYLDEILGPLEQNSQMPRADLTLLKGTITGQASTAPASARAEYQYAAATCDAIGAAMDARDKAAAASQAPEESTVGDTTNAISSAPRRKRGSGKEDMAENRKDNAENKSGSAASNQTGSFIASGNKSAWDDQSAQYRTQIDAWVEKEAAAEAAAVAANAASTTAPAK
jgi:hypothetical protein